MLFYNDIVARPDVETLLSSAKTAKERAMVMWDVIGKTIHASQCAGREALDRLCTPGVSASDEDVLSVIESLSKLGTTLVAVERELRTCLPPLPPEGSDEHFKLATVYCYFDALPLDFCVFTLCAYNVLERRAQERAAAADADVFARVRADRAYFDAAQIRKLALHAASTFADAFSAMRMPALFHLTFKARFEIVDEWAAFVRDADDMDMLARIKALAMFVRDCWWNLARRALTCTAD